MPTCSDSDAEESQKDNPPLLSFYEDQGGRSKTPKKRYFKRSKVGRERKALVSPDKLLKNVNNFVINILIHLCRAWDHIKYKLTHGFWFTSDPDLPPSRGHFLEHFLLETEQDNVNKISTSNSGGFCPKKLGFRAWWKAVSNSDQKSKKVGKPDEYFSDSEEGEGLSYLAKQSDLDSDKDAVHILVSQIGEYFAPKRGKRRITFKEFLSLLIDLYSLVGSKPEVPLIPLDVRVSAEKDWGRRAVLREELDRSWDGNGTMTRFILCPENVTKVALTSRVILFLLQAFVANVYGFAKHDNDGFKFEREEGYGKRLDGLVSKWFGGLANWDGQYFLHIAVHGYTEERMMAFFPLFPWSIYIISKGFHFISFFVISLSSLVQVIGWVFNTVCFVKTAKTLTEIAKLDGAGSNQLAAVVLLLFSFNPASIFFSGLYTESLFAYLTSNVILSLMKGNMLTSMMWAGLSSYCRSNGLLNFGFIAFYLFNKAFNDENTLRCAVLKVVRQCSLIPIFLIPFLQFQAFGVWKFCDHNLKLRIASELPPYCYRETFVIPYSYVQRKYWNVGFLKYFELKQIPNFLLALPVLYFLTAECTTRIGPMIVDYTRNKNPRNIYKLYVSVFGLFLALFCFTNVHVQVSTRLILAAFPYFYVQIAKSCRRETTLFRQRLISWPVKSSCVQCWCFLYFVLGGILFPLGYPWT